MGLPFHPSLFRVLDGNTEGVVQERSRTTSIAFERFSARR
jgi:hypothetical protein